MATQPANHEHEDQNLHAGMSTQPVEPVHPGPDQLAVDDLLGRARPLPPHEEMVIDGVTEEEGAAFLAALDD